LAPYDRRRSEDSMLRTISFAVAAFVAMQSSSAPQPLIPIGAIDLPRVEGRIDHLAFDTATQRLFVAALGNNTVEVLDVKSNAHLKSLTGFHEPQGIAIVTDARLVAVANGQGEGIQLFGADDYRLSSAIKLGDDSTTSVTTLRPSGCTSDLRAVHLPRSTPATRRSSARRSWRAILNPSNWTDRGRASS